MKRVMAVYRSCACRAGSQAFVRKALQPAKGPTLQAGRNWAQSGPTCTGLLRSATAIGDGSLPSLRLMILHDLWRRPDHFNLSADFLNLCGLLLYGFG